jgi:hypothetical protein
MNRLEITRGDTKVFTTQVTGEDKSLSGATIRMMFRRTATGVAVITKSTSSGITVTSDVADNRAFTVTLLPADTSSLSVRGEVFSYDVEITYADGYVATTESGTLVVNGDVTFT